MGIVEKKKLKKLKDQYTKVKLFKFWRGFCEMHDILRISEVTPFNFEKCQRAKEN
jgi:hypothetical protein